MNREQLENHLAYFESIEGEYRTNLYMSEKGKNEKIRKTAESDYNNILTSCESYLNSNKELYVLIHKDFKERNRHNSIFRISYFEGSVREIITLIKQEINELDN